MVAPRQHRALLDPQEDLPRPPRPRPQLCRRSSGLACSRGPVSGQCRSPSSVSRSELPYLRPGRPLCWRVLLPDEEHGVPSSTLASPRTATLSSTSSVGSVTATPTFGRGSPGNGPSPPFYRSVTTLSRRSSLRASSQGPHPRRGPRLPRLPLPLLLHCVRPLRRYRLFFVLLPPGRAGVGGRGGRRRRGGGRGAGPGLGSNSAPAPPRGAP